MHVAINSSTKVSGCTFTEVIPYRQYTNTEGGWRDGMVTGNGHTGVGMSTAASALFGIAFIPVISRVCKCGSMSFRTNDADCQYSRCSLKNPAKILLMGMLASDGIDILLTRIYTKYIHTEYIRELIKENHRGGKASVPGVTNPKRAAWV